MAPIFRMKVWVTLPSKEPGPVKVLGEGHGNTEWLVDEGSYTYHVASYIIWKSNCCISPYFVMNVCVCVCVCTRPTSMTIYIYIK